MINVDTAAGIPVLTMAAGENRFNLEFVTALTDALAKLAEVGGPFVLTGEGKFFCNGLDLDFLGEASVDEAAEMFHHLHVVLAQLLEHPGVVVAAINGHAFGAGVMLAAAADFRVQRSDRGYFCLPEVDLGMTMTTQFDALLRLKYPTQTVLRALVSGDRYGGGAALESGLVDAVAAEGQVVADALEIARRYADKTPSSVANVKVVQHAPALSVLRPA